MYFNINLLCLMLGFFLANILSTLPAQTGDWNIISGGIIATCNEIISKFIYKNKYIQKIVTINFINNIKIGILYGLFVDAFKLGS
uniref:Uncharacterized protein ycf20 n=1 Tax=Lophocladia kuetzingii TaxID=675577 RepID=A0A1Z1MPC3_9FLOR|nr:hypothetical protein [Lophocladia kuetzingii]ARW67604.1 hypothetical protein [Lophocladia kuetzingii]